MTTDELLTALARECPNGVSFAPMAVRLLRQKIPFQDEQIEDLKKVMFQVDGGLWLSREMFANDDTLSRLEEQATGWIKEYGYFSVKQLFDGFRHALPSIATPEGFVEFLRHSGFHVTAWGKAEVFCTLPSLNLEDAVRTLAATLSGLVGEADGTLTFHEIEQIAPHLAAGELEHVRARFLPEIHSTELSGVSCWCSSEAIMLPEDFSEKLTAIVDTLEVLNEKVSVENIAFALNLFYRVQFREEYSLIDNSTFLSICEKYYQGSSNIFSGTNGNRKITDSRVVSNGRVRRKNTRFSDLGIPIGAQLMFTQDNVSICIVADETNQVEYSGKLWAISSLAMHLLNTSSPKNGFDFFSYMGEILWNRRIRLEREGNIGEEQASEPQSSIKIQEKSEGIIGLSGQVLSASTWRAFKRDGTSLRVKEWAFRVSNGESLEQIAKEAGYAVPTMKGMISNYHLYFKVCKLNGIASEDNTNV